MPYRAYLCNRTSILGEEEEQAVEMEDFLQAWYAAATSVCPADTVNGGVVRNIQTTYDRPKKRRGRGRSAVVTKEVPVP